MPLARLAPVPRLVLAVGWSVGALVVGALVARPLGESPWAGAVQHGVAAALSLALLVLLGEVCRLGRTGRLGEGLARGWVLVAVALAAAALTVLGGGGGLRVPAPVEWVRALLTASTTALGEEVAFRGVALVALLRLLGAPAPGAPWAPVGPDAAARARRAVAWSALVFGAFHLVNLTGSPDRPVAVLTQVGYTTLIGLLLGAVYLRSGSLWAAVLLHTAVDLVGDLVATALPTVHETTAAADLPVAAALVQLLLVSPCLPAAQRLLRPVSAPARTAG